MPRELNERALPSELIGKHYKVSIENDGCLHITAIGFQLQLTREESHQLLAFLVKNSTERAEASSAHEV